MRWNFVVLHSADYACTNEFLQNLGQHGIGNAGKQLSYLSKAQGIMYKKLVDDI